MTRADVLSGSTRRPRISTMSTVPMTSGMPTSANSKNAKPPAPASLAASETMTLTGVPVGSSNDPALPANASGMSSRDGGMSMRSASATATGQQRSHRSVQRDERGQHGTQQHHEHEQLPRIRPDAGDELLAHP